MLRLAEERRERSRAARTERAYGDGRRRDHGGAARTGGAAAAAYGSHAARARTAGDGQSGSAGRRPGANRPLEWAVGGDRGALAGPLCRGWGGSAGRRDALGPTGAGGCRLPGDPRRRVGDATKCAGIALRRVDLRAAVGLPRAADGRADLPRLVARALGAARLGMWTA
jgi:hypothetical protein